MTEDLNFQGKTVLITGSTRGIGFGHAQYLASLGANLLINGISDDNVATAVETLRAQEQEMPRGDIVGLALPVTQGEEIIEFALKRFPRIDAVINNAGIVKDAQFKSMTLEQWDDIYRVHLEAAFRISRTIWPHYLDNGGGKILMTASSAGLHGNFGQANYSAMKAGIIGFAKTLSIEGKKHNIQVNTICPGAHTDMNDALMNPAFKQWMTADKVSPVAAWLCHETCADTGVIIEAAGGWMARVRYEYSEMAMDPDKPFNIDTMRDLWPELSEFKTKVSHPTKLSDIFKILASQFG